MKMKVGFSLFLNSVVCEQNFTKIKMGSIKKKKKEQTESW